MLSELIERYGEDAILTASPVMLDTGETYRWDLKIDGNDVPEAALHSHKSPRYAVLLLVGGDEEIELARWSTKHDRYGPAAVLHRLGDLSG